MQLAATKSSYTAILTKLKTENGPNSGITKLHSEAKFTFVLSKEGERQRHRHEDTLDSGTKFLEVKTNSDEELMDQVISEYQKLLALPEAERQNFPLRVIFLAEMYQRFRENSDGVDFSALVPLMEDIKAKEPQVNDDILTILATVKRAQQQGSSTVFLKKDLEDIIKASLNAMRDMPEEERYQPLHDVINRIEAKASEPNVSELEVTSIKVHGEIASVEDSVQIKPFEFSLPNPSM